MTHSKNHSFTFTCADQVEGHTGDKTHSLLLLLLYTYVSLLVTDLLKKKLVFQSSYIQNRINLKPLSHEFSIKLITGVITVNEDLHGIFCSLNSFLF